MFIIYKFFKLLKSLLLYLYCWRSHFGAYSNGDRSRIVYNITKPPENGTFYWVAGEMETRSFTQKDIDNERVLYAQINMEAYQVIINNKVI